MINELLNQQDSIKNNAVFFKTKNIIAISILILFIVFGAFYVRYTWVESKNRTTKNVLKEAHAIEVSLNGEALSQLRGVPSDNNTQTYKDMKTKLMALVNIYHEARFIYFYTKVDGKLFFMVDSEPTQSKDCSPAGQEYTEEDPEVRIPFESGKPLITKPATDRWGTWVSVLVPMKNSETGEVVAVLGIDYPADKWLNEAKRAVAESSVIVIAFLLLLMAMYIILKKNSSLNIHNLEREIADKHMLALVAAADQIDDVIAVKDLDLRVISGNKAFVDVAGKSSMSDLIGKTDAEIYGISPDIEPVKTYMGDERHAQTLSAGDYILREENLILPDGQIRIILTKKFPVYNANNKLIFTGSISRDITERKKAEVDLKNSKELAEAASVAKSDFLSNMSHEIRTPLNGVIGFTELLRSTPLNNTQKEYLENAIVSANSLLGVISDILDFSKIEAGKLDLELVKTDMVQLMESATDIIKVHAANKKIELLLSIQPDMPRFALVDPIRLKQILVNLMSNAVKFTHHGEVELRLSFEKKDEKTGFFTLAVRDTGIGVKDTDRDKLFKAFSQADTSTTRRYGGTGLGLIISNSLAHKMGSRIQFESEFGKGSKFFFTVETSYETAEDANLKQSKSIKRVLVIDDNANNRMILEHTFKHWGIDFVGCDGGLAAIEILNTAERFDLIIVDYHMPDIDGVETIRRVRQDSRFSPEKQAVIMLHSSSDDIAIHDAARDLNIQFSLTKPVKSDELYCFLQNIESQPEVDTNVTNSQTAAQMVDILPQLTSEIKILIAEDNKMNMIVISKMLKNILPNVKLFEAGNGEEALSALNDIVPDLVLMDVQMPVMDGVEATKRIRANTVHPAAKVLVVALTAGVSKEEKDNCYNAGMNYFLSKPIDKDLLYEMIVKYLDGTITLNENLESKEAVGIIHFDRDKMNSKFGNDEDVLKSLLAESVIEFPKYLDEIQRAISADDKPQIKATAHTLKGSAYNMEFMQLGNLALEVEQNADNHELLKILATNLIIEWAVVLALIS
ncbi:MAG: response regulator [Paludibacter sp.]|nr:response regulator [Paludibacter sp.]